MSRRLRPSVSVSHVHSRLSQEFPVPTYLRRSDTHLVKLLLVVCARLGAVVRHEDQLLA